MNKKILILSTSPRKGGNSEALAEAFARGTEEAGNHVELISLHDKTIGFCRGCLACQRTKRCVIQDDADAIVQTMLTADAVVFATPIYFYGMCGQMKTLLDRSNPLFPAEYAFRDIYLLAAAADGEESAMDGTVQGLRGWLECFAHTRLAGTVFAGGVADTGEIKGHAALETAYRLGKTL